MKGIWKKIIRRRAFTTDYLEAYRHQTAREVHRTNRRRGGPGPFVERVVGHVVREHDEEHEQQPQAETLPRRRATVR